LAKAVPMPARPRMPPMVVAAMVLRAWRREVLMARALVSSSKREGSISLLSFLEAVLPPHMGNIAPRVTTMQALFLACARGGAQTLWPRWHQ
jgi:hypothetical protein